MPEIVIEGYHMGKMNVGADILRGKYIFADIL